MTMKLHGETLVATDPAQVRALFNRIAPHYDRLNSLLSLGLHHHWKQQTVAWAQPPQGGLALDLCCGSGDIALRLAETVGDRGRVIGVDFAAELLAIARRRDPAVIWLQADALALPLDCDRFDAVTMGYGLRNVGDIPQALAEIYRVLKPGAWCAILDFQRLAPDDPRFTLQQTYLQTLVVPVAQWWGIAAEYAYIAQSLEPFPTAAAQVELARATGFDAVQYHSLSLGLMGVLVAQKPL